MKRLWADIDAVARLAASFQSAERGARPGSPGMASGPAADLPASSHYRLHQVSLPAVLATGDFAEAFAPEPGTLMLAIADVSGKGVQAALVNGVARGMLRALLSDETAPGAILARLDRMLRVSRLGSIYMTLLLARYHVASGRLRYANAGHPLPFRVGPEGAVREAGRVTGPILGILETARWEEDEVTLAPGERLLMFTDGALEATSPRGRPFGARRLRAALSRRAGEPLPAMCEGAAREIQAYQAGRLHDDTTLFGLERRRAS